MAEEDEPLYKGAVAPDWFYVGDVPRTLGGQMRRSYVLWQEWVARSWRWNLSRVMVR